MADITDGGLWESPEDYIFRRDFIDEITRARRYREVEEDKVEEKNDLDNPVNTFFEAYNIEKIAVDLLKAMLAPILIKKHSERTDEEKNIIRQIIRLAKEEKPKISVERQKEEKTAGGSFHEAGTFHDHLRRLQERNQELERSIGGLDLSNEDYNEALKNI